MATKKAPKALTKCEECGTRLPVHLLGLVPPGGKGLKHICSCTAAYTERETDEFHRPDEILAKTRNTPGPQRDGLAAFLGEHSHGTSTIEPCFIRKKQVPS